MTSGVGERHHSETRAGLAVGRGRRFCGEGSFAARKIPRTISRLSERPSSAQSLSVTWESLKPRYLPRGQG
jgi:hypothetical protein